MNFNDIKELYEVGQSLDTEWLKDVGSNYTSWVDAETKDVNSFSIQSFDIAGGKQVYQKLVWKREGGGPTFYRSTFIRDSVFVTFVRDFSNLLHVVYVSNGNPTILPRCVVSLTGVFEGWMSPGYTLADVRSSTIWSRLENYMLDLFVKAPRGSHRRVRTVRTEIMRPVTYTRKKQALVNVIND